MTPRAHFWRLIETKYSLTVNQTVQRVFGSKGDTTLRSFGWFASPASTGGTWRFRRFPTDMQSNINPSSTSPGFGESHFLGNSQIPDPVNILIVFPIPAPHFGQIPKIRFQTLSVGYHGELFVPGLLSFSSVLRIVFRPLTYFFIEISESQ